jgi:hypothetical protein
MGSNNLVDDSAYNGLVMKLKENGHLDQKETAQLVNGVLQHQNLPADQEEKVKKYMLECAAASKEFVCAAEQRGMDSTGSTIIAQVEKTNVTTGESASARAERVGINIVTQHDSPYRDKAEVERAAIVHNGEIIEFVR